MPCYDSRDDRVQYVTDDREIRRLRARLNKVTALLCSTCKRLDLYPNVKISDVEGLPEWWKQHQIEDKLHEAADKALKRKVLK
jgi:hypothetical protein